jgi:hypothetical protein
MFFTGYVGKKVFELLKHMPDSFLLAFVGLKFSNVYIFFMAATAFQPGWLCSQMSLEDAARDPQNQIFSPFSPDFNEKCLASVAGCCVSWRNELGYFYLTFAPLRVAVYYRNRF